jgi:uncharacterized protein
MTSDDTLQPVSRIRPPFTHESALAKVKAAENAWNSRDPEIVAQGYTEDSDWRNRTEFFKGRDAIRAFLRRKWAKELDYRLMKELWCFSASSMSGTTLTANGFGPMAMSTGNSMTMASCAVAT